MLVALLVTLLTKFVRQLDRKTPQSARDAARHVDGQIAREAALVNE